MAMICNDDCISMLSGKDEQGTQKNSHAAAFPKGIPVSFKYDGKEISLHEAKCEEKVTGEENNQEIFRRTVLEDGLAVEMKGHFYDNRVVDFTVYFENTGSENTKQLTEINAYDLKFTPPFEGPVDMSSHWENPKYTMDDEKRPMIHLMRGNEGCKYATLEEMSEEFKTLKEDESFECTGCSCGEYYSPYFITDWPGGGVCLALGWSGFWKAYFHIKEGVMSFKGGLKRCNFYMKPGEKLRMPRVMYVYWEGEPEDGYNAFRRAYINYIAPRDIDGKIMFPPISSPCPDENATNGENEINWVQNVMDDTGAELYWHDAWWHVGGFPAGQGNYTFPIEKNVDHERYPRGVKILGDIAHEKGYKFMLWFSPEFYPENCTMANEHPEYILREPGRRGGTLNMASEEALDYMFRYLDECIKTYGVDVFRTDDGIHWGDVFANEEENREGVLEIKVVEGLYKLWDGIRERNPGLIVDNCCGGGTRLDLELCSRSYSLWRTDTSVWYHVLGDMLRHPVLNQVINMSLNRFVPFTVCATCNYDPYTVRSGFNGGLTINMDLRKPDFDKAELRKAYAEVRRLRQYFLGDFYRLINDGYDPYSWCSYQYNVPEESKGCVFVFRRDNSPYPMATIGLKGLDPKKKYEVDFYYGYEKAKTEVLSGAELMSYNVALESAPGSLLMEYREKLPRHYR